MVTERPRRADAIRNRALVLAAAEQVFAEQGAAMSTDEVARAAGVGVGTVFRHFPTKGALLEAVYYDRLDRLAQQARALLDDEFGFATFFRFSIAQSGQKRALADALAAAGINVQSLPARNLVEAVGALLANAKRTGHVRADIELPDVFALLVGAYRAVEHAATDEVRSRAVEVILNGLRPA